MVMIVVKSFSCIVLLVVTYFSTTWLSVMNYCIQNSILLSMLYFIIPICSGILNISTIIFPNEIISIMEHFHIYQPNIQNSFLSTRDILKLCKKLSNQNREITKINQSILPYRSNIQFQEISDFNWTIQNFALQNKGSVASV